MPTYFSAHQLDYSGFSVWKVVLKFKWKHHTASLRVIISCYYILITIKHYQIISDKADDVLQKKATTLSAWNTMFLMKCLNSSFNTHFKEYAYFSNHPLHLAISGKPLSRALTFLHNITFILVSSVTKSIILESYKTFIIPNVFVRSHKSVIICAILMFFLSDKAMTKCNISSKRKNSKCGQWLNRWYNNTTNNSTQRQFLQRTAVRLTFKTFKHHFKTTSRTL